MVSLSRYRVQRAIAVGICYFLAAAAAVSLTRIGGGVALAWPASAILLVELAITSRRTWPLTLACAFAASVIATGFLGLGPKAMVPLAVVNIGEAVLAALIIRRYGVRRGGFASRGMVFTFIFAAAIAAPVLSATFGSLVVLAMGQDYWFNWLKWVTAHSLGALIVAPLAWLILSGEALRWLRQSAALRIAEATAVLGAVAAATILVFRQHELPLLFVPVLPVMIATFRTGGFGAVVSIVLLALIGGGYSVADNGPIALIDGSRELQLAFFQFYLAVMVLTVLPVAADLKRREHLHARLAQSEARYRLVTERSSDIIMNSDHNGTVTFVSPSITTLGGYLESDVLGHNALEFVHPKFARKVRETHERALAKPHKTHIVEYLGVTKSGRETWFESHMQAVHDKSGEVVGAVSSIRNMAHRKLREEELAHEAETDGLTGLLNRRGFMRALDACLDAPGARLAGGCLAMFDIDHFKSVNDRFGHAGGDAALVAFAAAARGIVRDGDVVGRVGGEEFALLLRGAGEEQALAVCERLRVAVARLAVTVDETRVIRMTVSAGVAALQPSIGRDAVMRQADEALYLAKANGRNQLRLAA